MWSAASSSKKAQESAIVRLLIASPMRLFGIALCIRLALIAYGLWQDAHMVVKYTDIDYVVFTDAARFLTRGESPYLRSTYRYTPLLAQLLTVNIRVHEVCGKGIFVLLDLLVGWLLYDILKSRRVSVGKSLWFTCFWLLNPFAVNVSTRGNAESLIAAAVLLSLHALVKDRVHFAAIMLGIAIHLKIYPVIFLPTMMMYIGALNVSRGRTGGMLADKHRSFSIVLRQLLATKSIVFAIVTMTTFAVITSAYYFWFGWEFLEHSYLYHVTRQDHRHNFSAYFYALHLSQHLSSTLLSSVTSLVSFLPQALLMFGISVHYSGDPSFAIFAQTFAFVMFNKVFTVQYFIWFFSLLPLVLPTCVMTTARRILCFVLWIAAQAFWLNSAYHFEFLGENNLRQVWVASILFFAVNLFVLVSFFSHYQLPTTRRASRTGIGPL